MGKGGYLGGSTVISPSGRGWSYDPLAEVSQRKKKPNPKPSRKLREADTEWLKDFATSCAACVVLGIGYPPRNVLDESFDKLFDGQSEKFHKPFRAKIGASKVKARETLKAHFHWVATDVQLRKPTSNLPKILQFCTLHPRFNDAIMRGRPTGRKWRDCSDPSTKPPRKPEAGERQGSLRAAR